MARSSDTQDDELAEFLQRAEMVRQQVDGLAKGTLAAEDVKMPGQDNWAYAAASSRKAALALTAAEASAEERAAAVAQHRKWDAQRAARLAAEEADRWWRFARMQYGEGGVNAPGAAAAAAAVAREEERASGIAAQPRWRPGSKGAIDYSWWDKYAVNPDDEVTVAEARRLAEEKERAESEAFEKANPGFCMGFRKDELERAAADRAKAARAEELKAQGNAAYAAGDFPAALGRYHEALRLAPFNVPVLNNIAMAHLSLGDAPAAREFCSRTLHIEPAGSPAGVKALFRRAAAARALADAPSACADLTLAAKGDPKSTEVAAALLEARTAVEEGEKEARLGAAGAATASATAFATAAPSPGTPATPSPLPLAPPSLAPDGLPSNAAIADTVALSDMTLLQLLARAKARLVGLDAHTPGTPQRTAELRALSRELRALSGAIGTDEDRVRVRACGVLDLASRLAVGIAERVTAGEGAEGAAPAPAGEALSTMAVLASLFLTLTPLLGNPRNRACLRASCTADAQRAPPTTSATGSALVAPDIPSDSVLGAALALLRARDSDSAAAWCAAFGPPPSGGPAEVKKWQYQLLAPLAAFAEAYARPAACDPIGRAALAFHAYISAGGVTLRLWQTVRVVREAPPSGIPVGALETLHSLASTLQFLASFDHTAALLSALTVGGGGVALGAQQLAHGAGPAAAQAAAGPFAPMIKAVNEAVSGLAALAAGQGSSAGASGSGSALKWDDAGRGTNPIPVLIQAILALMGRALIDSLGSLTQAEGGDAAADDASFFQSPALLAVTGALSNLCAHEAFAAFACSSALQAILPSSSSSSSSSATFTQQLQPPQGVQHTCDFVLYPLLDMLRLRPMGTLAQGGGGEPTWNAIRAAACSALANACAPSVPHAGEALEALVGAGGIPTLLGLLREGGVEDSRAALCSRAAMLLGRLASAPSGVLALGAAPTADAVLALLRLTLRGAGEREEAGMVVDGLLRCLAVCAGAEGGAPRLLAAGACAALVQALRAGALDSLKVGFSGKRVRSVGVGNALKTLIALCEGIGAGGAGEAAGARLLAEGACEAATEALMCPGRDSDANAPIVRKNAATAVAKLSLHAACKERLRSLRALEALVQLKELH